MSCVDMRQQPAMTVAHCVCSTLLPAPAEIVEEALFVQLVNKADARNIYVKHGIIVFM